MTWFVVSVVSVIENLESAQSVQTEFTVFEDFYLFQAYSEDELQIKIKERMEIINSAGKCRDEGVMSVQRCIGFRSIRSIYNEPPLDIDKDPPNDCSELTHSCFIAKSISDVLSFASGIPTMLLCVGD